MLEANINPETSEILCPTCNKSDFKVFRRRRVSEEIYLNQCKCEGCG
jgi:Zn finger protein HypA/HybF involved in hydrogenase expression